MRWLVSRNVRYGLIALAAAVVLGGGAWFVGADRAVSHDLGAVTTERIVSTGSSDRIAIKGYDPVAYFTEGRAVRGSLELTYEWHDAVWQFARAEHRELFQSDPAHYAPQYGGFCSSAVLANEAWDSDPEAWAIIDGKLYLSFDQDSMDRFERGGVANIAEADGRWQSAVDAN